MRRPPPAPTIERIDVSYEDDETAAESEPEDDEAAIATDRYHPNDDFDFAGIIDTRSANLLPDSMTADDGDACSSEEGEWQQAEAATDTPTPLTTLAPAPSTTIAYPCIYHHSAPSTPTIQMATFSSLAVPAPAHVVTSPDLNAPASRIHQVMYPPRNPDFRVYSACIKS